MNTKRCPNCKEIKIFDEFYKNKKNKKNGLSAWCKICNKINKKQHYKDNKEQYHKNQYKNKSWFIDYKMTLKCERCGFNHPAALDFHHLDPSQKEFGLSLRNIYNKDQVTALKEIEKCIVLCANCHRIEHSIHYNKILENK